MTAPTTRTDGIDFAAILGESAVRADAAERDYSDGMDDYDVIAVAVLAAKVPELCPDCQSDDEWLGMAQTGAVAWDGEPYYAECAHPNAPTIADLLAIGQRTWVATYSQGAGI